MLWVVFFVVVCIPISHGLLKHFGSRATVQVPSVIDKSVDEVVDHKKWRQQKLKWHHEGLRDWQNDFEALLPDNEKADLVIATILSVNEQRTISVQIPYIVSWGGSKVYGESV